MKNRYRNPWYDPKRNDGSTEFYENDAPVIAEHRGVKVHQVNDKHFDYVIGDCCITQRAGASDPTKIIEVIDGMLDGTDPTHKVVADHLKVLGFKAKSYDEVTA